MKLLSRPSREMAYSYDRRAGTRVASFWITNVKIGIEVDLSPEKVTWGPNNKVLMSGKAGIVLPNRKHDGQSYELEVEEDGTVLKCSCSDPIQQHLVFFAAKERKKELRELIEDQKDRGGLRKKT